MAVSKELTACREKRKRLKSDLQKLAAAPDSPATRLKLLIAKRDLQDLVRQMREHQTAAGQQMARSTAVTQAVNAYARTAQAWKNRGR